jgi:signal transduction histidine kinase
MSIRLRLTLYWSVLLAGILLLSGVAVFGLFARGQWAQLDSALMEEADSAAAAIGNSGIHTAHKVLQQLSQEPDLGPGRRAILIVRGRIVADAGLEGADLPRNIDEAGSRRILNGRNHVFRYGLARFEMAGVRAILADGVDATPVRLAIARLRRQLLLVIPMILALSIAGGYWLAGRALAPISELSAGLAEIEPRDLSRRLASKAVEDEVAQLTRAINGLLERVARAAETERRFAADAAHEMRTPLAVLRTGLEVTLGRERSNNEYQQALDAALHETVNLCHTADELLALARLDHELADKREPVDLGALTETVLEITEPLIQSKQIKLCTKIERGVIVEGNRNHLQRLVINLLDNALKFAPVNGRVVIEILQRVNNAIMRVENNGPAIPADDLPHIFERFFRSKTSSAPGSGLGLNLCEEIVTRHEGEIHAVNLQHGGVEFLVRLPRTKSKQIL